MNASPSSILLLKDNALCLNVRPFSKTSQMVTWLSEAHGRITTPIKGALRPKSAFLGRYDLGYTCELVFYAHSRADGVHNIRECSPLIFREALRTNWRRAATANYACDLALRTAQPGLANPDLFRTLSQFLDTLECCPQYQITLALLWFEARLLQAVGVTPDFTRCPHCDDTPRHLFSVEEGYLLCPHRPTRLRTPPTLTLHDDILQLFAYFLEIPLPQLLAAAQTSTRADDLGRPEPFPGIFGLRRFLGIFLNVHLDLLPGPRRTILDLLIG